MPQSRYHHRKCAPLPTRQRSPVARPDERLSFKSLWECEPIDRVKLVWSGVPSTLVKRVASEMHLSIPAVSQIVGLPPSTVYRKLAKRAKFNTDQGERILGLARLIGQVQTVVIESGVSRSFQAGAWVARWVNSPQPSLEGWFPRDLMDLDVGRQLVFAAVARIHPS